MSLGTCSATADCSNGDPDVMCTASGASASCSFANTSCPGQQGYVECNGARTYCRATCPVPPVCLEGQVRYTEGVGCCCLFLDPYTAEYRRRMNQEQCINNQWVAVGSTCTGEICGSRQCAVISP